MASSPTMRRASAYPMSSWPIWTPSQPVSATRSGRSFIRKATPRSCAMGRRMSAARRTASSSASFRRSWTQPTSSASSAARKFSAKAVGSKRGGVMRYSRQRSGAADISWSLSGMTPKRRRLRLALVDLDDRIQKLQRLLARPLETVAADDGTGAAAVADLLDFLEQTLRSLGGAAGEYDEPAPVEGGLHHMADACRHAGRKSTRLNSSH